MSIFTKFFGIHKTEEIEIKNESKISEQFSTKINNIKTNDDVNPKIELTSEEKECVHILAIIVDSMNIGNTLSEPLGFKKLKEIDALFEKLSDRTTVEKLHLNCRPEYKEMIKMIDNEKNFSALKLKVKFEIAEILHNKAVSMEEKQEAIKYMEFCINESRKLRNYN